LVGKKYPNVLTTLWIAILDFIWNTGLLHVHIFFSPLQV
jgi:hypothetical protein